MGKTTSIEVFAMLLDCCHVLTQSSGKSALTSELQNISCKNYIETVMCASRVDDSAA